MTITLVPLTGHLSLPSGDSAAGASVTLQPNAAMVDPGTKLVLPERITVTADGNGDLPSGPDTVRLFACDDPGVLPDGLAYRLEIHYPGAKTVISTLFLPHTASSVDIADAVPGPPAASSVPFATAAALAGEAETRAEADDLLIPLTQKGAADGVATLDETSHIPDAQIPSTIARDTEVATAVAALVNAAPSTLNTLKQLADALGDDPNFATTLTDLIATKAADADVVHITGDETKTGAFDVEGALTVDGIEVVDDDDDRLADERVPPDGTVTLSKLAPSVRSAVESTASGGYIAKEQLTAAVQTSDIVTPVVASELTIPTIDSEPDLMAYLSGVVTAVDAGVHAIVELLEGDTVIATRDFVSPYDNAQFEFSIRSSRPGPLVIGSDGYVDLAVGYAWTADDAAFHADDLRMRMLVAPAQWANAVPGSFQTLASQYKDPTSHGWVYRLDEAGDLYLTVSFNGSSLTAFPLPLKSLTALPVDGEPLWIEVARRKATGVTSASVSEDGETWVQVSSGILTPGSAYFASDSVIQLGAFRRQPPTPALSTDSPLTGRIYAFELATATAGGDWTVQTSPDFRTFTGGSELTDPQGRVWRVV